MVIRIEAIVMAIDETIMTQNVQRTGEPTKYFATGSIIIIQLVIRPHTTENVDQTSRVIPSVRIGMLNAGWYQNAQNTF